MRRQGLDIKAAKEKAIDRIFKGLFYFFHLQEKPREDRTPQEQDFIERIRSQDSSVFLQIS